MDFNNLLFFYSQTFQSKTFWTFKSSSSCAPTANAIKYVLRFQCDLMARLFVQNLAIYSTENSPNSIKMPK